MFEEEGREPITWNAEIIGRVYMLRVQEVIGPIRALFHSVDINKEPTLRAGKKAEFYLKLTVDYRRGRYGLPNTYDGIPLILDESLPENEVQFIGDSTYSLFISNIRSMND